MNPISVAAAVIIAVLSLACASLWKVASHEREARAIAEAQVAQWQSTAKLCSESVEKAQKASQEANKRAKDALAKAKAGNVAIQAERKRLADLIGKQASCAVAVQQVRNGLSK